MQVRQRRLTPDSDPAEPSTSARPTRRGASRRSRQAIAERIMFRVQVSFASDTASLMLLDESGQSLTLLAQRGLKRQAVRNARQVPVGQSISGIAVRERRPLLLNGDLRGTNLEPLARRPELGSAICVPIQIQDRCIGVVNASRLPGKPPFSYEHARRLQLLAEEAASDLSA